MNVDMLLHATEPDNFIMGELQKKWLAALDSNKFSQGRVWLCYAGKFCSLGVALAACLPGPYNFPRRYLTVDEYLALGLRALLGKSSGQTRL